MINNLFYVESEDILKQNVLSGKQSRYLNFDVAVYLNKVRLSFIIANQQYFCSFETVDNSIMSLYSVDPLDIIEKVIDSNLLPDYVTLYRKDLLDGIKVD